MASSDALPTLEQVAVSADESLSARFFVPLGAPRGAVLIAPAMGVPQGYYAAFARWLAGEGFLAATFDFRGIGASQNAPLAHVNVNILDWADDCSAMLEALRRRAGNLPITWIGHSLGGQLVPFVRGIEHVAKVLTVATGSGYWRENSRPLRYTVWLFWFVLVPLFTPLFGYFPGKRLRKVGDLPRGVALQWRRWCLSPEYVVGVEAGARERFAAVKNPIVSLSFTDDEMMSAENTTSIHGFFVGAPRTMKRLSPQDVGVSRIGHFGFFRRAFETSLWRTHLLPELRGAS